MQASVYLCHLPSPAGVCLVASILLNHVCTEVSDEDRPARETKPSYPLGIVLSCLRGRQVGEHLELLCMVTKHLEVGPVIPQHLLLAFQSLLRLIIICLNIFVILDAKCRTVSDRQQGDMVGVR
jgi:hypothetical protein